MKKSIGASHAATKSGKPPAYCPNAGEIVWLDFRPAKGHEQDLRRPALVLSPRAFNEKSGLCIACPITNTKRGNPFEVILPDGIKTTGAVLSHQVRALSWPERGCEYIEGAPLAVTAETRAKIKALTGIP